MKIHRSTKCRPADAKTFTGSAQTQRLADLTEDSIRVYRVEFNPGARTHWHTHSGPQLLVILEGCCQVQSWTGPVEEARAGDLVRISPNEKHWHGAAPDAPMTHLAINLDAATTWMEAASIK